MTYLFIGIRLHTIIEDARELSGGRRQLKDKSAEAIIHQGSLRETTRIYEGLLLLSQRESHGRLAVQSKRKAGHEAEGIKDH